MKDAPFYIIVAALFWFFMKQTRDTQHEQNAINAVQAENQNSLIAGVSAGLTTLKELLEKRFTIDDARASELQTLFNANITATEQRTQAAKEQTAGFANLTTAMSTLETRMADVYKDENATTIEMMKARVAAADLQIEGIRNGVNYISESLDKLVPLVSTVGSKVELVHAAVQDNAAKLAAITDVLQELMPILKQYGTLADSLDKVAGSSDSIRSELLTVKNDLAEVMGRILAMIAPLLPATMTTPPQFESAAMTIEGASG